VVGYSIPWVLQSFAVAVAAQYGGIGAGLIATALAALLSGFLFRGPLIAGFLPAHATDAIGLALFSALGIALSVFGERLIAAKRQRVAAQRSAEEQRRLLRELHSLHERLKVAHQVARLGTFEWSVPENRIVWTPELEDLYGLAPGAFEGEFNDWMKRVRPEDARGVIEQFADAVAHRRATIEGDFRIILPDGGERWLHGRASITYDASGQPLKAMGINIEVTRQKEAERALRESRRRLETLAETVPGVLFTNRPDGAADYCSKAWWDYTGATSSPAGDCRWEEFLHPHDRQRAVDHWMECVRTGAIYDDEYRVRRSDGEYRWFRARSAPIHDAEGQLVKWFGLCMDIHELRILRGLLSICAGCKMLQDTETGGWMKVEAYMEKHAEVQFSHGLCPACIAKLYPEFAAGMGERV
jgi:PAS domain S-box-containing protein